MVGLVHIAFVLHPHSDVSATHSMTGLILTKYAPSSDVRFLNVLAQGLVASGPVRERVVILELPLD